MWLHYIIVAFCLLALFLNGELQVKLSGINDRTTFKTTHKTFESIFLVIFISFLYILAAFRHTSIGNDTSNYLIIFNSINSFSDAISLNIEVGYSVVMWIAKLLNLNFQWFLIFVTILPFYSLYKFIKNTSSNYIFSSLLFYLLFFSFFMSGIRQSISIGIILIAHQQLSNNRRLLFIFLVLIASLFHSSSIIFLVMLIVYQTRIKLSKSILLVLIVIAILFGTIVNYSNIIQTVVNSLFPQYIGYFSSEYVGGGLITLSYEIGRAIFLLFLILLFGNTKHLVDKNTNEISKPDNTLVMFYLVLVSLFFLIISINMNLIRRVSMYFMIFYIIIIPQIITIIRNKYLRFILYAFIVIIFTTYMSLTLIFRPEWNHLFPYFFYWNSL